MRQYSWDIGRNPSKDRFKMLAAHTGSARLQSDQMVANPALMLRAARKPMQDPSAYLRDLPILNSWGRTHIPADHAKTPRFHQP